MKLIGTKPNETADEAIIRCANNLVKAVLASGRSIHNTSGCSGLEITFYDHRKDDIVVENILSGWKVWGKTPLKITFRPEESELVQDDAEGEEG
jgi:hypothetical protein